MIVKKTRMGRPPAPWVYKLLTLDLPRDKWVTLKELSDLVGTPTFSLKIFFNRFDFINKKYEFEGHALRSKYLMGEIKLIVGNYAAQWPTSPLFNSSIHP